MLKTAAVVFGAVFLLIGVLGFIPGAAPNGMLLGLFHVNDAHNIVHLLTGMLAIAAGFVGTQVAKLLFQVFGVLYALIAFLGFAYGQGALFGLIANNMADAWLHVLTAVVALFFGFAYVEQRHAAEGPRL
jgi:hypothetical protein